MTLLSAVKTNNIPLVWRELNTECSQEELDSALQEAASNGAEEVVQILLNDRRADPVACDPLAKNYAINAFETRCHALHMAAYKGFETIVDMLLRDKRSDPASGNYRAIKLALKAEHVRVLRIIDNYFYDNYILYKPQLGTVLTDKLNRLLAQEPAASASVVRHS